jgi:hypothetical protein
MMEVRMVMTTWRWRAKREWLEYAGSGVKKPELPVKAEQPATSETRVLENIGYRRLMWRAF